MSEPQSLARLVEELEGLPGVGRRSAERLAHHLLRVPASEALALADAIRDARERIRACSGCRAPAERDPCPICSDPGRERGVLMVVETARDLAAVEKAGGYRGLYFVLGGRLSPLEPARRGRGKRDAGGAAQEGPPGDDRAGDRDARALAALADRVADGVTEVVLATNPDFEGDGASLRIRDALRAHPNGHSVRVTRLARGLPTGGQIEYQSAAVLAEAFEGRTVVDGPDPRAS